MIKKETYEQAMKKLEQIVAQMENNELDIDQLVDKLKEAQFLIKVCKKRLYYADEEIKKMLESSNEA